MLLFLDCPPRSGHRVTRTDRSADAAVPLPRARQTQAIYLGVHYPEPYRSAGTTCPWHQLESRARSRPERDLSPGRYHITSSIKDDRGAWRRAGLGSRRMAPADAGAVPVGSNPRRRSCHSPDPPAGPAGGPAAGAVQRGFLGQAPALTPAPHGDPWASGRDPTATHPHLAQEPGPTISNWNQDHSTTPKVFAAVETVEVRRPGARPHQPAAVARCACECFPWPPPKSSSRAFSRSHNPGRGCSGRRPDALPLAAAARDVDAQRHRLQREGRARSRALVCTRACSPVNARGTLERAVAKA